VHHIVGVLCNSGLSVEHTPVLTERYEKPAQRVQKDGSFGNATSPDDIGLLSRPFICQVSRWDRLKGFRPLLDAFVTLKRAAPHGQLSERSRRRFSLTRLVLAGPDPSAVADDPEALAVLSDLRDTYLELPPEIQDDVVLLSLPMQSARENALMVNALQSCATVVVQNSLREGFGLTATEAMWKAVPTVAAPACGLRQQIRDGVDGRMVTSATDVSSIADTLIALLSDEHERDRLGKAGQRRVYDDFLIFTQLGRWLRALVTAVE
jgi:trehalose synthase